MGKLSIAALSFGLLFGCTVVVPARDVLPDGPGADALRPLVTPGAQVLVREGKACHDVIADNFSGLELGGEPIASAPWSARPTAWRVVQSRVRLEDEMPGFLALELAADDGRHTWIRSKLGASLSCVAPASPAVADALAFAGKTLAFTPWKPSCTRVEAAGKSALAELVEGRAAAPFKVDGIVAMRRDEPWLGLEGGTIRVPLGVATRCFSPAADAAPAAPIALLHTDAARCEESADDGKPHVQCRSSVGVWSGKADASGIDLRLVRRTLGDVNITDGRPVDGRRYARTVVSVATGHASDARLQELYASLGVALAQAVASEDTSVRVAKTTDPAVTCKLKADVDALAIGELVRREEPQTSQYQEGFRDVPNPEFPHAQQAVSAAEGDVKHETAAYDEAMKQWQVGLKAVDEAKKLCEQNCDRMGGWGSVACKAGCIGGGVAVGVATKPERDKIQAAETRLGEARRHAAETPPSTREPVMRTWSYKRVVFERRVSAALRLEVAPRGADAREVRVPLASAWQDYEVAADPAHNVAGHDPDRRPIEHEDAVMPMVTRLAAQEVAKQLHVAIEQMEAVSARRALAASGADVEPGFELLDATAFGAASGRLRSAIKRGRSRVAPPHPLELPAMEPHLGPGKCVIVVAVADAPGTQLSISTRNGAFADARGKSTAFVEICANEAEGAAPLELTVTSSAPAEVRWAMYAAADAARTRAPSEPSRAP